MTPLPPPSEDKERKSVRPSLIEPAPSGGSKLWLVMTKRSPQFLTIQDVTSVHQAPARPLPVKARDAKLLGPLAFALILVVAALVTPYLPGVPH